MQSGTIKKLVSDRGFGFIAAEDGKEYFFHRSGTEGDFDSLNDDPGRERGVERRSLDLDLDGGEEVRHSVRFGIERIVPRRSFTGSSMPFASAMTRHLVASP